MRQPLHWRALMPVSCLIGLVAASVWLTPIRAQGQWAFWNTSADAPPGMPAEAFSAPDDVMSFGQAEELDPPTTTYGPATWRVTGSALKPRENDVSYTVDVNGACSQVTSGDTSTVWNVAPALPDGAVVNTLRMYYYDTSASNSTAWFTVYDLYGAIVQEWSVSTTGNSGNSVNDSAPINHTIDYATHSYLLNWRPNVAGATMRLCGFRVFYTVPLPVPGPPQGLVASVSGRTVALTWSAPITGGPAASYVLEAGSGPGLADIVTTPVAGTSLVATNVPPGQYYVRVRAINAAGTGAPTGDVVLVVS